MRKCWREMGSPSSGNVSSLGQSSRYRSLRDVRLAR